MRLIEVNQSSLIEIQLYDGDATQFPRVRVYDNAGTELTGAPYNSPIDLTHRATGLYTATVTPTSEAEVVLTSIIYSDAGHTVINKKYNQDSEAWSVRSVDQDLATLLTRITAIIETKAEADARQVLLIAEHDATQAALAVVDGIVDDILVDTGTTLPAEHAVLDGKLDVIDTNVDAILVDTDTTIPAQISGVEAKVDIIDTNVDAILVDTDTTIPATLASIEGKVDAINIETDAASIAAAVWDEARASHVAAGSFGEALDATVSSRATQTSVDTIDGIVDAILVDTGTSIPAGISVLDAKIDIIDTNVDAILVDTDTTIPSLIGLLESKTEADIRQAALIAEHDATQAAIAALNDPTAAAIADAVWDELLADHNAAGSMGENQNLIDNANSTIQTNLDATVSSRATQTSVDTIDGIVDDILVDTGTDIPASISAVDAKVDIIDTNVDAILVDTGTTIPAQISALNDPTAAAIADAVWDELLAGHGTAGSAGLALFNSGAGSDPNAIASAVWDEAIVSHVVAGSFGATNQGELTAARAANLDNLDATISSRASQSSVNLIETKAQADARQSALIAEHDATQADVAAVDAKVSSIQNNTRFVGIVPPVMVKDASLSKDYKFIAQLFDEIGNPEDPDGATMNVAIETVAGVSVLASTTMTKIGVGHYEYTYALAAGAIERPLVVKFTYTEAAIAYTQIRTTEVQEFESKLDTLLSRLTAPRASNLDNLDATISSRESEASASARAVTDVAEHDATQAALVTAQSGITGIKAKTDQMSFASGWVRAQVEVNNDKAGYSLASGQVAAIADAVWDELQSGHTTAGTFGRYLDARVALVETEASASARAATNQSEHDATQVTLGTVNSNVSAIKTKTDQLAFTGGNVHANVQVNSDKTGYSLTTGEKDDIVDRVWDESNAAHIIAGSTGENLANAGGAASPATIADAVWDELKAGHTAVGSFGEAAQGIISIARANNLDNLDATITSRATQASVDAIQNNTRFAATVQSPLVLPVSGSKSYKFFVRLSDTAGNPEDPDSNSMNYRIETVAGGVVVATAAMSRTGVGLYETTYVVNSTDTERPLNVFFEYLEGAIAFQQVRTTEVQEFESKLDTLLARLTAPRALNLDNLDATITSRQSESDALTRYNALIAEHNASQVDIAAVQTTANTINSKVDTVDTVVDAIKAKTDLMNFSGANILANAAVVSDKSDYALSVAASDALVDKVWDELVASHVVAGSMGLAMGNLDASITSRASAVDLASVAADVSRLDTDYTTARAINLDFLDAAITSRATQVSVDGLPTVAGIADGVWDEAIAGHLVVGSTGEALSNAGLGTSPSAIADAVWDELLTGHVIAGSFGEALDVPVSSRATQVSVDAIPTNPVLTTDSRLDNLDVPVSSVGGGPSGSIIPEFEGDVAESESVTGGEVFDSESIET